MPGVQYQYIIQVAGIRRQGGSTGPSGPRRLGVCRPGRTWPGADSTAVPGPARAVQQARYRFHGLCLNCTVLPQATRTCLRPPDKPVKKKEKLDSARQKDKKNLILKKYY